MAKARFWVWSLNGGWARLTLAKGQSLSHSVGGPTDEGWFRQSETYTFDGESVLCGWLSEGRDCDGYTSSAGEYAAAFDGRHVAIDPPIMIDGIHRTDWQPVGKTRCRDEYAEHAGY